MVLYAYYTLPFRMAECGVAAVCGQVRVMSGGPSETSATIFPVRLRSDTTDAGLADQ